MSPNDTMHFQASRGTAFAHVAAHLLAALLACCPAPAIALATFSGAGSHLQLERVILLYRHGVRTPLPGEIQLDDVSGKAWPAWTQAPGALTPHGAAGVRLMGQ